MALAARDQIVDVSFIGVMGGSTDRKMSKRRGPLCPGGCFINKKMICVQIRPSLSKRSGYPAGIIHPHKLDRASTTRRSFHPPGASISTNLRQKLLKDGPANAIEGDQPEGVRNGHQGETILPLGQVYADYLDAA
jgi:hypothetical protein